MRVPTYDNLSVQARTAPSSMLSANDFRSPGIDQQIQMGQAMGKFGAELSSIAVDAQQEANRTVAKDLDVQALQKLNGVLYDPKEGYLSQAGKNAVDGYGSAVEQLNAIKRDIVSQAKTDSVRSLALPAIETRIANAMNTIGAHNARETRSYEITTSDSRAVATLRDSAFNFEDEGRFRVALAVASDEAANQGRLHGWDETTTSLKRQQYVDNGFRMRYDAWSVKDPLSAFAHYSAASNEISPSVRDNIGRQLFQRAAPILAEQLNRTGGAGIVSAPGGDLSLPRGERNNNPGNLVRGSSAWEGEVQGNDPRYASFSSPEAGIRAMGKTLIRYQKYGLNTVSGIIGRWAPASENDTASYVRSVAKALGVGPDAAIDVSNAETLTRLTKAIIQVENGKQPYTDQQITAGLSAATGATPLPPSSGQPNRRDISASTGIDLIDRLPGDWKQHVLQLAQAQGRKEMAEARESLRAREADTRAEYLANGFASNPPGDADYVRAYGQEEGLRRYQDLQSVASLGQSLQQVKTLPSADLLNLLQTSKPAPGDGFAERQHNYTMLTHAVNTVIDARKEDPIAYAITNGSYSIRPIERFNDPKGFVSELSRRAGVARQIATDYGTPLQVMAKSEADAFAEYISSLQAPDKARVLGQVFTSTGAAGIQSISTQLKDKHQSVAIAGMLTSFNTTAGNSAALLYLQGKEAIEQKRAKIDEAAEIGTKAEIYKAVEGVYQTPQGRDAAAEAAFGIYAKFKADGGGDIAQAVRIATGGIMEHNGSKIAKPYGWQDSQFRDALRNRVSVALAAQGSEYLIGGNRVSAADFAKMLPGARLQTYGQGSYLVMAGNDVVRSPGGVPFILKVGE